MAGSPNTVLGKYRILREIARSNDIVYEAIDPKMNRRVAVKELQLPLHLAGPQKRERIERFYREAKAAGTLTHPNIVTIHEVGQENERHFLVMEYLDGQSLRDILQMQGALPLKETIEIALQMCEALTYAHTHGIVHRDVKPDNLHILPGGIIKLTDFGIARITAEPSITSQGQVFGTPSYMSPEQIASQTVDHRTDLFSLGITLYEMLSGRKPFVGDSVITITYNIMNSQPPVPFGVPPALQSILQKALAKDPNQRYQSAAAMSADLRAEKFALAASQSDRGQNPLGNLNVTSYGYPVTMDTGSPAPFPGMPGHGGPQTSASPPPLPYGGNGTGPAPLAGLYGTNQISSMVGGLPPDDAQGKRRGAQDGTRSTISLALAVFGMICLVALIVWGIIQAFNAVQAGNKRTEAVHYAHQAAQALKSGDYEAAANSYRAAQLVAPVNTPEARSATQGLSTIDTRRARQEVANGDLPGAQASYQQAISLNAHNASAYDDMGNLDWQKQDENGALDAWKSAITADASSAAAADARNRITEVYMDRGSKAAAAQNFTEARNDWQQVIAANPGSSEAMQAQENINKTPLPNLGGGQ